MMFALSVLVGKSARSEEGSGETDPFYPSADRPSQAVLPPANTDWGRDPFSNPLGGRPSVRPREESLRGESTQLTGIIFGQKVRLAIIGGETLREGAMVGRRKVMEIRMRSVVLLNPEGGREEIFLRDFSIRK